MASSSAHMVALVSQQMGADLSDIRAEDDYDLMNAFEKKTFLRDRAREKLLNIARKEEKMKRIRGMSGWISEGQSGLADLQMKMKGLKNILHPHLVKKDVLEQLNSIFKATQTDHTPAVKEVTLKDLFFLYLKMPQRILSIIRRSRNEAKDISEVPKSSLIHLKYKLICHIRLVGGNAHREEHRFIDITEEAALMTMQKSLKKQVGVPKIRTLNWRLKQDNVRKGVGKFEVLLSMYEDCEAIAACEHRFHFRPLGCPNCKVVYLSTKKNTSTKSFKKNADGKPLLMDYEAGKSDKNTIPQYVKSVNIETGVQSLVALDFEFLTLQAALERQQGVIQGARLELQTFEDNLLTKTVIAVQNWFCCFSARRKCRRAEERRVSSLFYHRIRRLVSFKRETDCQNIFSVDRLRAAEKYSELQSEVEEYLDFKLKKKLKLVEKVARVFVQKLKVMTLKRRRKNFFDETVLAEHVKMRAEEAEVTRKKIFLADMRYRVNKLEGEKFVCLRFGCDKRCFFSKLRYDCHALIHKKEDAAKEAKRNEVLEKRRQKERESRTALDKIRSSREAILSLERGVDGVNVTDRGQVDGVEAPLTGRLSLSSRTPPITVSSAAVSHLDSKYYLEVVSVRKGLRTESRVTLDRAVTRIGTADTCECLVRGSTSSLSSLPHDCHEGGGADGAQEGQDGWEGVISRVHCMIYGTLEGGACRIRIVDNSSKYGTYVLSARGTTRVSKRLSEGTTLRPDDLICLGVAEGSRTVSSREVSEACLILGIRTG